MHVELGQEISQDQRNLYNRQREYKVPSINRGQILKLTFLNSAIVDKDPSLWVDVQKKGVKLVYRQPLKVIHGESHPNSAVAGMVLGCLIAALLIANQVTLWQAVCISMVYGFIAATPGAYFLKSWKKCRLFIAG